MQKKIGNVLIDYKFYNADLYYSDGDIEEVLMKAAQSNQLDELLNVSNSWGVLYHCSNIRENLLEWYPFKEGASLLEIGSGCGALTGLFSQKLASVTCVELSERRAMINAYRNQERENIQIFLGNIQDIHFETKFDYITLIGVWEYAGAYLNGKFPYLEMLRMVKQYLKEDGVLLIAIENKMGIKYWNGAVEDHTGKMYSGLNDYIDDKNKARTFTRPEIEELLNKAEFSDYRFYYPMPDYKLPEVIYSDERLPQPGEIRNYKKDYNATHIYNFYDAAVCDQLCRDRMFAYFANSFLVECGSITEKVVYARYNRIRKREYGISTTIIKDKTGYQVEKKPLTSEAKAHVKKMREYAADRACRFCFANGYLKNNSFFQEYIEGEDLDTIFYQYRQDSQLFIKKTKEVMKNYLCPDKDNMVEFFVTEEYRKLFGDNYVKNAMCLQFTNLDLTFSNLRLDKNGRIHCIDYEWIYDFPIPYEYVLWRGVTQLYTKYMIYLKNKISRQDYLTALGLEKDNLVIYGKMEQKFVESVYGTDYLSHYRKQAITYDLRFV